MDVNVQRKERQVKAGCKRSHPEKRNLDCLEDWMEFDKPLRREGVPVLGTASFHRPRSSDILNLEARWGKKSPFCTAKI